MPEDVALAESRIRRETIATEDDIGALIIYCSDSHAIGRVGEMITKGSQTADKMTSRLKKENRHNDNLRLKLQYRTEFQIMMVRHDQIRFLTLLSRAHNFLPLTKKAISAETRSSKQTVWGEDLQKNRPIGW